MATITHEVNDHVLGIITQRARAEGRSLEKGLEDALVLYVASPWYQAVGDCANCGHPIVQEWRLAGMEGTKRLDALRHGSPRYPQSVGCRAASWDRDGEHDDHIDRRHKARMAK